MKTAMGFAAGLLAVWWFTSWKIRTARQYSTVEWCAGMEKIGFKTKKFGRRWI